MVKNATYALDPFKHKKTLIINGGWHVSTTPHYQGDKLDVR